MPSAQLPLRSGAATTALCLALSVACARTAPALPEPAPASLVDAAIDRFIGLYAARRDMQAFASQFRDDGVLVDTLLGLRFVGPAAIAGFYDWDAPGFELVDPSGPVLRVDARTIDGPRAALRGQFLPFRWQGASYGATDFVILLTFDATGRITRQEDWIAYPRGLLCAGEAAEPTASAADGDAPAQ